MTASSMTTYAALLKERYLDPSTVEKLVYPENPLLGMLEKRGDTGMVGKHLVVPIFTKNPQGFGGVFSTAQTNATPTGSFEFSIEAGSYYGVVNIDDKTIAAARTNTGAFLEHKRQEIDGLYETGGENLSLHAWGNGGGALCQIATLSTNDFTVTKPEQLANLEIDMAVKASANDGSVSSHTLRAGTSTTVASLNRATGAGALTLASNITSLAAGDHLFRESDFAGDQSVVIMKGVQCFVTGTDSPMALWGITAADRALDPQRYAGCRVDPTTLFGKQIDERIKILMAQMTGRFKAKAPTAGFLHPEDFQTLDTLMEGKGVRAMEDSTTKFGYTKIDILTPGGKIPIYLDRHCPKGTFFAFRMDNWWISSMRELLHPQSGDGNEILRRDGSTNYEFRLLSYPLLACNAPKNSGRVSLT